MKLRNSFPPYKILSPGFFAALVVGISSFNAAAVNLIQNGSFEAGNYLDGVGGYAGRMQLGNGSAVITNWVVGATTGNFWWLGAPNNAQNGSHSVDLDSNGQTPTYIQQTFATTAGLQYLFTASFSSEGNGGPAVTAISINGNLIGSVTVGSGIGEAGNFWNDLGWTTKSFLFTATASTSTLRLQDATGTTQFYNPLVDNVSVELAVPEPSTLALSSLSLIGWLAFRRTTAK